MSARRDSADGPEDIDAAFAEIVAGLEQDAPLAQWPDEQDPRPRPGDAGSSENLADPENLAGPDKPGSTGDAGREKPGQNKPGQSNPGQNDSGPGTSGLSNSGSGTSGSGTAGLDRPGPVEPAPMDRVDRFPADTPRYRPRDVPGTSGPRDWTPGALGDGAAEDEDDEGHFVPPEPPPLPRPSPSTLGGIGLVILGAVLLAVPSLVGSASTLALPLGLVAISGGIGWLLFRMRQGPPPHEGDDGAHL